MNDWYLLVLSLPTAHTAMRQRAWRTLKASGAAVLRDGAYLLPKHPACHTTMKDIAAEVEQGDGRAWILSVDNPDRGDFTRLFDRSSDYTALQMEVAALHAVLTDSTAHETLKQLRKLNKTFAALGDIDFFPGALRPQTESALVALAAEANTLMNPGEPHATTTSIHQLNKEDYQGRTWATRQRPWIDRLASAWLIQRFIDPAAQFMWLAAPGDCPADALGFDFDGATFTHVGDRVTFEVLLASFALTNPSLQRIATLVHYLDVGGLPVPEAAGVEGVLAGLRNRIKDDDALLALAFTIFDGLFAAFAGTTATQG